MVTLALPVDPLRWLDAPDAANFDVVAVYYGSNPNWTCPGCLHTFHGRGPKCDAMQGWRVPSAMLRQMHA